MSDILKWGIQVVLWFQQFSPWLDLPFITFTFMGEEATYLLLLSGLYWCVDRRIGAWVTVLFLLSAYFNAAAKVFFDQPRPFEYDSRVRQLVLASGRGLPSGHAQNSLVVWGYLATQFRRAWLWWLAGLLIIFISLSRIYLGVHFPTDIVGGHLLGASLLFLYLWLEPGIETWLKDKSLIWPLSLTTAASLLLIWFFPTESGITAGAALFGLGSGFILERRWLGFEAGGPWRQRLLRFAIGAIVMMGLWLGLHFAFFGLEPTLLLRFVQYALIGLWGAFGGPWFFARLRLAEAQQPETNTFPIS
jgi:membrane-associated phospholipid phosphatase